jgi:AmmeMemoRadiSam system protein B
MKIRAMRLTSQWYPHNAGDIVKTLNAFAVPDKRGKSMAVLAPHSEWLFTGSLIGNAIASLAPDAQTVVILGGHLAPTDAAHFAIEDAVQTPLGILAIDTEMRMALQRKMGWVDDRQIDNSIEVLLPAVHFLFPHARVLWIRLPDRRRSYSVGYILAQTAVQLRRKTVVIASSDLSRFDGRNLPLIKMLDGNPPVPVSTEKAVMDIEDVNDRRFVEAVLAGQMQEVFRRSVEEYSACSVGAVLAAMGFCTTLAAFMRQQSAKYTTLITPKAKLLGYTTNHALQRRAGLPETSTFLSYAAMTLG